MLLLPAILFVAASVEAQPAQLLSRDPAAPPVWVSLEGATTTAGKIDWSLLGDQARANFEGVKKNTPSLVAKPPGDKSPPEYDPDSSGLRPDCVYYGASYYDSLERPADHNLRAVIKNAPAILRGEVVALTPGFYQGEPSTLLTVRVDRVLRQSSKLRRGTDTVFVVYPRARFTIEATTFCKGDSRFPYQPTSGDQLLLFPFRSPEDASGQLILPSAEEMVFETADGTLALPKGFLSPRPIPPS
jgi:hypothetical protein